jgi:hypothetical protein
MLGKISMPPERDWREPPDEARDAALQYSDIAIGYLGRNARYRADYRRALARVKRRAITADDATAGLVRRWGISFHTAPASAYNRRHAVAQPDLSSAAIMLAPALPGIGAALAFDLPTLGDIRARIRIGDFLHIILADAEGDEHLCIYGSPDLTKTMMLMIGTDPLARFNSAARLCRRLLGMPAGPPLRPSPFRREHLLTLLQALDGQRAGATQRELAATLIHRKVHRYTNAEWIESKERKRIRRWLKEAIELRDGGYLRLLRGA